VLLHRDEVGVRWPLSPTCRQRDHGGYIDVTGVEPSTLKSRSRRNIVAGLTDHPWGLRDFVVEIPGGHRLAFGERISDAIGRGARARRQRALLRMIWGFLLGLLCPNRLDGDAQRGRVARRANLRLRFSSRSEIGPRDLSEPRSRLEAVRRFEQITK